MLTVGLPAYNAKQTIWLAYESLCRQADAPPWELVVCEEQNERAGGRDMVAEYEPRLRKAGCVEVKYLPLKAWIPLSRKWATILDAASYASTVFVAHAADCWSGPGRLKEAGSLIGKRSTWLHESSCLFYDVHGGTIRDHDFYGGRSRVGPSFAFTLNGSSTIGIPPRVRGVDAILYRWLRPATTLVGDRAGDLYLHGVGNLTDDDRLCYRGGMSDSSMRIADLGMGEDIARRIEETAWRHQPMMHDLTFFVVSPKHPRRRQFCWIEYTRDESAPAMRFEDGSIEEVPLENLTELPA